MERHRCDGIERHQRVDGNPTKQQDHDEKQTGNKNSNGNITNNTNNNNNKIMTPTNGKLSMSNDKGEWLQRRASRRRN